MGLYCTVDAGRTRSSCTEKPSNARALATFYLLSAYWKVVASRLRLEVLAGPWESHLDGWWRDTGTRSRVLQAMDVYSRRDVVIHADSGCPAVAFPSDRAALISPFLTSADLGGTLPRCFTWHASPLLLCRLIPVPRFEA